MNLTELVVNSIFSAGLFINGLLFIPQAIRLLKTKSSEELSKITFLGFVITQLAAVFYGIIHEDSILLYGYLFSLITCGFVTFLIFFYHFKK